MPVRTKTPTPMTPPDAQKGQVQSSERPFEAGIVVFALVQIQVGVFGFDQAFPEAFEFHPAGMRG